MNRTRSRSRSPTADRQSSRSESRGGWARRETPRTMTMEDYRADHAARMQREGQKTAFYRKSMAGACRDALGVTVAGEHMFEKRSTV